MQKLPKISNGVNSQKGQIQVVLFLLVIIGAAVLFFTFSKPTEKETPEVGSPSKPVFQEEGVISSPEEEEIPYSPSPVSDYNVPYRFNSQPSGGLLASTRATFISLETDEKAICRYSDVSGMSYDAMKVFSDTNSTFHSTQVTGFNEGEGYGYYVKCADEYGNANTNDFIVYFFIKKPDDFTPPVRSNQYPTGDVLPAGTTQTIIGISTNEPASCRYDTKQGTSYNSMKKNLTDDGTKKYHTAKITGLSPGNSYNYFVRCKDLKGNVNTGDVMIHFSVRE